MMSTRDPVIASISSWSMTRKRDGSVASGVGLCKRCGGELDVGTRDLQCPCGLAPSACLMQDFRDD